MDEAAHVTASLVQVQHDIGHALARSVIGELPAPSRAMHRKPIGREQVRVPGRDPGRVERRVFQQPDHFIGRARRDGGDARLHGGDGGLIVDIARRHRPFDGSPIGAKQRTVGDV
ncbi:hypothetical protein D3C80_881190 [compost metagenome]